MATSIARAQAKYNLPMDLIERLARKIPSGKRSKFVEAAIDKALRENAKDEFFDLLDNFERVPTNGEDPVKVMRRLRQERTGTIISGHKPLTQ